MTKPSQSSLIPDEPYKTKKISLNISSDLPEKYVGPEPDAALVTSIRQYGVIEPIVVRPMRGKYALIDGRRRVAALRKLIAEDTEGSWQYVAAVVVDTNRPVDAAAMTVMLHATRDENVAAEIKAIEEMAARGASERDIFEATGLSIPTIRKRMKMLNFLIPELRELLETAKITPSVAEAASKLKPSQQKKLMKDGARITSKDVRGLRSAAAVEATAALPDSIFETTNTHVDTVFLLAQIKEIAAKELAPWNGSVIYDDDIGSFRRALQRIHDLANSA